MEKKKFSLWPYVLMYKWHYMAGILILIIVDLAGLYVPQYTGEIIDGLSEGTVGMDGVKMLTPSTEVLLLFHVWWQPSSRITRRETA